MTEIHLRPQDGSNGFWLVGPDDKPLRLIGYWIVDMMSEYLPPQEFGADIDPPLKRRLVDYLQRGRPVNGALGHSWCRCCDPPGFRPDIGSYERCDGVWVWPQALAHYVSEHGVVPPEEFVAHVMAGGSTMLLPAREARGLPNVAWDDSFWTEWCWTHCSAAYWQRLEAARAPLLASCCRAASSPLAPPATLLQWMDAHDGEHDWDLDEKCLEELLRGYRLPTASEQS